jgi:hypothetical protein
MTQRGSIPTGPSEQYLRLLKGEITPEEYRASVKDRLDAEKRGENGAAGSPDERSAQQARA